MSVAAPKRQEVVRHWSEARPPVRARARWKLQARANQLPPAGEWFIWMILAGRGWGKTKTGAEWAAERARRYPGARIALCAQTFSDGRDTMVEGESGLLNVLEAAELRGGDRDSAWNRSMGELYLENGSRFKVFSSEKPSRLRGPQHHFAWADEPATFLDAAKGPSKDSTWSNLEFGCRLTLDGSLPQIVATGTPKPVRLLTQKDERPYGLLHRDSTIITRGHTDENLANLAKTYRTQVVDPFRGTRLGRQELAAEILADTPGALWQQQWIEDARSERPPSKGYRAKVMGLDPADGSSDGAEQAWTIAGLGLDHELYVLACEGMRTTVRLWLTAAVKRAHLVGAMIVIEKNHGGAALIELLEAVMLELGLRVPYRTVWASTGKQARAEPAAMLYEQGKVHHLDYHPELEEQMCSFTGAPGEKSPDRLDSLVWALEELRGYHLGPPSEEDDAAVPYTENGSRNGAVPWQ